MALAFAGCKYTTRDCIRRLLADGIGVDLLVTISSEAAARNEVAGYEDLRPFAAEHGIEVYTARRYDLKAAEDETFFRERALSALLVIGWERLVPDAVLGTLREGAFGMHGSPRGLPYGRGRSPLNWSLILGERSFRTSLFRYAAGVDDGDVVGTVEFEINEFDSCKTLHYKNRMAMNELLRQHLPAILEGKGRYVPQPDGLPTYYPRRRPEDGAVDWTRSTRAVHDHVRALARPYPGAHSELDGTRVRIWSAQPFGAVVPLRGEPGSVREVFGDGGFLVETGDGLLLVTDHEAEAPVPVREGAVFASVPLRSILEDVVRRYPPGIGSEQMEIHPDTFDAS